MLKNRKPYVVMATLVIALFTMTQIKDVVFSSTFVPCDPNDALCNLDCDLNGSECGYWIDDPVDTSCPSGQTMHATSGNCIYNSDASCQAAYGAAYYDGNSIDGCACNSGTTYNYDTGLCEYPESCPSGMYTHPSSGNCVYDSDSSCQWAYGAAYYDGNEIDGCACSEGTTYNYDTGLCEYPESCPVGMYTHPSSGNCVYDSDSSCQWAYGAAYYDGNEIDGCACSEGATYNYDTGLCEYPDSCPEGMYQHQNSGNCIYDSDSSCQAAYGAAYYDGNEIDGCACSEGAIWDGTLCVMQDYEIQVSYETFEVQADGQSTYPIQAWVVDGNGTQVDVPMWIDLYRPNTIRGGSLDIGVGNEGAGDTYVDATYIAPEIKSTEKIEDNDVIEDWIYVFAEINGEKTYKVITATLLTLDEDFVVTLTFEKDGIETQTMESTFNEGSLSGDLYLDEDGEKYFLSGVKVTLTGIYPDAAQTQIEKETYSENGYFFFENISKTGETDIGDIEMEIKSEHWQLYDKAHQYYDKISERATEYGISNPGQGYIDSVNGFAEEYAASSYDDAQDALDKLKMGAYALYFVEYYTVKSDESLDNFQSYMGNIMKDALSFAQGMVNITGGLFDAAGGKDTASAKVITKWATSTGEESRAMEIVQKTISGIVSSLASGLEGSQSTQNYMAYLKEFMGGIEQTLFAEGMNDYTDFVSPLITKFDNYVKSFFSDDLTEIVGKYQITDNVPDALTGNIANAEEIFKENTEKHNYRNELQYEWDVDTAALSEFINVAKPGASMILTMEMGGNAAGAKAILDTAVNVFNGLKVAASTNHTYEWYMLFKEDMSDLDNSLSTLFGGQSSSSISSTVGTTPKNYHIISRAYAEDMGADMSVILYDIATAVENDDAKSLELLLAQMDELNETYEGQENSTIDSLTAATDLNFYKYIVDLNILYLATDQSEESLANFREKISEFQEKEIVFNDAVEDENSSDFWIGLIVVAIMLLGVLGFIAVFIFILMKIFKKKS